MKRYNDIALKTEESSSCSLSWYTLSSQRVCEERSVTSALCGNRFLTVFGMTDSSAFTDYRFFISFEKTLWELSNNKTSKARDIQFVTKNIIMGPTLLVSNFYPSGSKSEVFGLSTNTINKVDAYET